MSGDNYYDDYDYDDGYGDDSYGHDDYSGGGGGYEADDYAAQDTPGGNYNDEPSYNDDHSTGTDSSDPYTTDSDTATQYTPAESTSDEHYAAQDEPSSQWSGGYNEPYTVTASGENSQVRNTSYPSDSEQNQLTCYWKGNHWCNRDYGPEAPNQNSYHYSNTNGSYYYSNPDGESFIMIVKSGWNKS